MEDFKDWLSSLDKEKLKWVGIVVAILLLFLLVKR